MEISFEQARTLFLEGIAHYEAGRLAQAELKFAGALALAPGRPSVLTNLGAVRLKLGRPEDALAVLEEAVAREPGNAEAWGHCGTALAELGRTSEALVHFERALDLGCGTGLCGPLLRPLAQRVVGVDLSAQMLAKAAAQRVYDELRRADVTEFLASSDEAYALVVAADVFVYVGALERTFAALARRMPAGGTFCFTVEESEHEELVLRASLRYAHSEAGIRRLADAHGFRVEAIERRPVREDQRQPIPGLFCWLRRAG